MELLKVFIFSQHYTVSEPRRLPSGRRFDFTKGIELRIELRFHNSLICYMLCRRTHDRINKHS